MTGRKKGMAQPKAWHTMTSAAAQMNRAAAPLWQLVGMAALLLAGSPAAAQVATSSAREQVVTSNGQQQLSTRGGQQAPSQAPTTGTFCIEEMTATFCNVPTSPNTNGYGSAGGGSASSGGSAPGGASASGSGSTASTGVNTSSIPPCLREPPADELCN